MDSLDTYYYELRNLPLQPTATVAADITRHLHARKHLGRALVVTDNPLGLMCVVRKQWLKVARLIQKQRAGTLNADKILRLTHAIAHMQRVIFTTHPPRQQPNAHIFFVKPDNLTVIPHNCYSVYVATAMDTGVLGKILHQLPDATLIIDYANTINPQQLALHPKDELHEDALRQWQKVTTFLDGLGITIDRLVNDGIQQVGVIDEALDLLLGESRRFLQVAGAFQHARELAQPLDIPLAEQQRYEMLSMLAHRVQALTPGSFTMEIDDEAFHERETFFLHDCPEEYADTNLDAIDDLPDIPHHAPFFNMQQFSLK